MMRNIWLLVTLGTTVVPAIDYICLLSIDDDEFKYEVVNQNALNTLCPTDICECKPLMTKC